MVKRAQHIAFFVFLTTRLFGQTDTVQLKTAQITHVVDAEIAAGTIQQFDSMALAPYKFVSLANVLQEQTGTFIKSYGAGQIATTSFRGMNASQTQVFWEDLNLQSASLGQTDFSLIPIWFFNSISFEKGALASAGIASSSAGGKVDLSSVKEQPAITFGTQFGSFSSQNTFAKVALKKGKTFHKIGVGYHQARNNFYVPELENNLTNAATNQLHIIGKHAFEVNANNLLNVSYWWFNGQRQNPPTLGEPRSVAFSNNEGERVAIVWKHYRKKWSWKLSSGLVNDIMLYSDSSIGLVSETNTRTWQQQVSAEGKLGKFWFWHVVSQNTLLQANSDGYQTQEEQLRSYNGISVNYKRKKHSVTAGVGATFVEQIKTVPQPGIQYSFSPTKSLTVFGKVARTFRLPSFNDLYWYPLGEPNLKPESGRQHEVGVKKTKLASNLPWSFQASLFSSKINNWIIWLPSSDGWKPQNKALVWSRGMEIRLSVSKKVRKVTTTLLINNNMVWATNEVKQFENDNSFKKQLIYVPYQTAFAKINVNYKTWFSSVTYQYTGSRYTKSDNTNALPAVILINAQLAHHLKINQHQFHIETGVNNLFNTSFQMVESRPMPGRNYFIKLVYNFKIKSNA